MRGGGLARFTPDPMVGGGWFKDFVNLGVTGFARGVGATNNPYTNRRAAVAAGAAGARSALNRAAKRKIQQEVTSKAKRVYKDIFDKLAP